MSELKRIIARGVISSLMDFIEEDVKEKYPKLDTLDMQLAKMFALGYAEGVTDEWDKHPDENHDMTDVAFVYKAGLELFLNKIIERKKEERK